MQPKKQLKVQYIGIFEEILFLLTKNTLLKRGPKTSGMGRPPLSFGQCPKENVFLLLTKNSEGNIQILSQIRNNGVTVAVVEYVITNFWFRSHHQNHHNDVQKIIISRCPC